VIDSTSNGLNGVNTSIPPRLRGAFQRRRIPPYFTGDFCHGLDAFMAMVAIGCETPAFSSFDPLEASCASRARYRAEVCLPKQESAQSQVMTTNQKKILRLGKSLGIPIVCGRIVNGFSMLLPCLAVKSVIDLIALPIITPQFKAPITLQASDRSNVLCQLKTLFKATCAH